jgi:hypothetical protein
LVASGLAGVALGVGVGLVDGEGAGLGEGVGAGVAEAAGVGLAVAPGAGLATGDAAAGLGDAAGVCCARVGARNRGPARRNRPATITAPVRTIL